MDWVTPLILGSIAGLLGSRLLLRRRDARLAESLRRIAGEPHDTTEPPDVPADVPDPRRHGLEALARRMERLQHRLTTLQERSELLVTVLREKALSPARRSAPSEPCSPSRVASTPLNADCWSTSF